MNSSKQRAFVNPESSTFLKILKSWWVSTLMRWKVVRIIDPRYTADSTHILSYEALLDRDLTLSENKAIRTRFELGNKLRAYLWKNIKIWWPEDPLTDKEVFSLVARIKKVDEYFWHPNFTKNLVQDVLDWSSLGTVISAASQIQGVSYFKRAWKFWFFDDEDWADMTLTSIQRFQLEYTIAIMKQALQRFDNAIILDTQRNSAYTINPLTQMARELQRFQPKNPSK
jgi:hypothetical protein